VACLRGLLGPGVIAGVVLAKEKFFGYLSSVEADEYYACSLWGEVTTSVGCLGCDGIGPGEYLKVVGE
jgi:hypothetical protein